MTDAVAGRGESRPATALLTEVNNGYNGNVTQIDADYLNGLQVQLQTVLTDVKDQLKGVGASPDPRCPAGSSQSTRP